MRFSIRALLGITLLSAILINPLRYFLSSPFAISIYKAFINVNMWFASWFLYFDPDYFDLYTKATYINAYPYYIKSEISPWGVVVGTSAASIVWIGIAFGGSCVILEIFGIKTPLGSTIDKLQYKIKMARYKHPK